MSKFADLAGLRKFKQLIETFISGLYYNKTEVDNLVSTSIAAIVDVMTFKGTIGTSGTVTALPSTTAKTGWTYKVIEAGTYDNQVCEVGDMIAALSDGSASTPATWIVLQGNIDGAVTGPSTSTANHVATFDGATGKVVKDSGYTIETSVPANAVFTDTTYEAITDAEIESLFATSESGDDNGSGGSSEG